MKSLKFNLIFSLLLWLFYLNSCNLGRKETQSLKGRVRELAEMSSERAIISITSYRFRHFIKATPRSYSFIVMLTALSPHRQCGVCRSAYDEFQLVANSWHYHRVITNKLFFGMIDFDDGADVFSSLGINSAPVFIHFPAKGKPKEGDYLDIERVGFQAETIAKWISERTDVKIHVLRPPNYTGRIVMLISFTLIGALLFLRRNNFDFLNNKTAWGVAILSIIFLMTSGQMWNHIRRPPFLHQSSSGTVTYIHRSTNGQYILETYIIFALYAFISLGMILLQDAATSGGDSKKQKIMAVVGLVLVTVFFSLLLSVFRMKAQGYPYSFLFK